MPILKIALIFQVEAAGMTRLAILSIHAARDLPEANYALGNFFRIEIRQ